MRNNMKVNEPINKLRNQLSNLNYKFEKEIYIYIFQEVKMKNIYKSNNLLSTRRAEETTKEKKKI
jgi:hypothetical protein